MELGPQGVVVGAMLTGGWIGEALGAWLADGFGAEGPAMIVSLVGGGCVGGLLGPCPALVGLALVSLLVERVRGTYAPVVPAERRSQGQQA
jgi:hypothetical protein